MAFLQKNNQNQKKTLIPQKTHSEAEFGLSTHARIRTHAPARSYTSTRSSLRSYARAIFRAAAVFAITTVFGAFLSLAIPATTHAYSLCDDLSKSTNNFVSCGQQSTTFTNFQGGLNAPDASGYSPGLTQATNARDYVKNVVNFALSFLGLIAVLVVIYGGFLYVTAQGKEDQAEKGKKSITYAVIGLLIIMGSFAIVNTVLQAPSGTDKTLNGSAPGASSGQNDQRRAFFNYAAIAVQTVAHDFVSAYQNYAEINADIQTLQNTDAEKDVNNPQSLKQILQNKKNILINILDKSGALSQVSEKVQAAILVYNKYLSLSDKAIDAQASDSQANNAQEGDTASKFAQFWVGTNYDAYINDINNALGENGSAGGLALANSEDFAQAVIKAYKTLNDLNAQMKQAAQSSDVDTALTTVLQELKGLVQNWQAFHPGEPGESGKANSFSWNQLLADLHLVDVALAQDANLPKVDDAKANNATILQIVNDMAALYEKVQQVQFEYAVIHADVITGNAPLVVNFDALNSRDPNNHTIPEANYTWNFGDKGTDVDATGVAVAHTFDQAGSYVVKLTVKAPPAQGNEKQPADGTAYQTITVKPPSSRINLRLDVSGKSFQMSEYDPSGFQTKSLQDIGVTTEEAKNGITFDASKTATGGGKLFTELTQGGTARVKWDFGDKSNPQNMLEGPPDTVSLVQKFPYKKEGSYRVNLEVTDDRGVTDRKLFNILVSSLAARVNVDPGNKGKLGDQFTFDGSASASDNGQIKTYNWKVLKVAKNNDQPQDLTPANVGNNDLLKYTFKDSGQYNVDLTVNDGSKDDTATVPVKVVSKPPIAQFTIINSNKTQPNTYLLDGSKSYDPDSQVDLLYKWEINAQPGDCLYLDGSTEQDCSVAFKTYQPGPKFMKPKVKLKKGKYTVTLDVHNPDEPDQSVPQEQQLEVTNDLDVAWGDDAKPITAKLQEAGTEVSFSIRSDNGLTYDLDPGDGGQEQGNILANPTIVKHTYTKAGAFNAKLTVYDNASNENSTTRKVFIASGDTPVAAISVSKDSDIVDDISQPIEADRQSSFSFDAGKSLNTDGTTHNLIYSWDLGDGTKSNKKQLTHTYKELTPKGQPYYVVTLKVSDSNDATKVSPTDEIHINVISEPPVIRGLNVIPLGSNLTTPVTVNVTANGATDPDGKIVSYRWWYYDLKDPETQRGLQITQTPNATLTIGTNGEENEKHTYGFAVLATDNDNQTFNTAEQFDETSVPTLEVTNGPNKAPIAKFSVDKTNVQVGDTVNFSSSSVDPDANGGIAQYIWDFEGDGFADNLLNNDYNKANVSYIYKRPYRDGVKVRLKVVDINGAEAISDPVPIFVEGNSKPPVAAFTSLTSAQDQAGSKKIIFTNNSKADEATGAKLEKYSWDFDLDTDSDGDGIKDNDVDSTEANPTHTYPNYGIYRTKLTIEDDQGSKSFVLNFVNVKAPIVAAPTPTATPTTPATTLEARLTSLPAASTSDGKIHLSGDTATVIFNFADSQGTIKTYTIDKNIYYDSNGNGNPADDEDYKTSTPGTWSTQYAKTDGSIRVRLTVTDATGKKSFVDKDVVFDTTATKPAATTTKTAGSLGADLFGADANPGPALLATLIGFAILLRSVSLLKSKEKSAEENENES